MEKKQRVGYSAKTLFGGVISLGVIAWILYYIISTCLHITRHNVNDFSSDRFSYTDAEMGELEIKMGDFNETLNFITGLTDLPEGFDIMNNPYVQVLGYQMINGDNGSVVIDQKYELTICDIPSRRKFMKPHTFLWYEQPLCFADREAVTIKGNQFLSEHSNPLFAIAYCKNDTIANGDWCLPKEQVDEWLHDKPNYFVHQETRFERELYSENLDKRTNTAHWGDHDDYFPTHYTMASYNFASIDVDPRRREDYFQFNEISLTLEKITIDDQFVGNGTRSEDIINVFKTRESTERRNRWQFADGSESQHLIMVKALMMQDIGEQHTRTSKKLTNELSKLGGLVSITKIFAATVYLYFGGPFRNLKMAISYAELTRQVAADLPADVRTKAIERQKITSEHCLKHVDICFYARYYWFKMVQKFGCLSCCACFNTVDENDCQEGLEMDADMDHGGEEFGDMDAEGGDHCHRHGGHVDFEDSSHSRDSNQRPHLLRLNSFKLDRREKPSFKTMCHHFDELKSQADYLLSLRNLVNVSLFTQQAQKNKEDIREITKCIHHGAKAKFKSTIRGKYQLHGSATQRNPEIANTFRKGATFRERAQAKQGGFSMLNEDTRPQEIRPETRPGDIVLSMGSIMTGRKSARKENE